MIEKNIAIKSHDSMHPQRSFITTAVFETHLRNQVILEEGVKHRKRELKLCDWPSRVLQRATVVRLMASQG